MPVNKFLRLKNLNTKQAVNMKNSVFTMLKRSFISCYTSCIAVPLNFLEWNCFIQPISYKNFNERCQKDPKISEYFKVYNLFFSKLTFLKF